MSRAPQFNHQRAPMIRRVHRPELAVEQRGSMVRVAMLGDGGRTEHWMELDPMTAQAVARAIMKESIGCGASAPDWYIP